MIQCPKAYVRSRRELGIVVKILVMSWNCTWSRLIGLEKIGFKETKSKSERSIRAMVQTGESNPMTTGVIASVKRNRQRSQCGERRRGEKKKKEKRKKEKRKTKKIRKKKKKKAKMKMAKREKTGRGRK